MKITIEFNSLEEFDLFRACAQMDAAEVKEVPVETVHQYVPTPEPEAPAPVEKEEPALIDEEPTFIQDIPEDEPAPEAEVDYELLRLETRKVLAELNRTVSGKPAQNLIKSMGYKGLTEVPGKRLQELKVTAQKMLEGVTA